MSSHFSAIGMPIASNREAALSVIAKAADAGGELIECKDGRYLCCALGQGAELWIQLDKSNTFIGATPFFRGNSRISVGITHFMVRPNDTPLEGGVYGWLEPVESDPEKGLCPFIFDLVDKGLHTELDFPFISTVQLTAFAEQFEVYDSDDEFRASQATDFKWAAESFLSSEAFNTSGITLPNAVISGHVLETIELQNPLTNCRYRWMKVKTAGGEVDVVSDPELVDRLPFPGSVIRGSFWLCGRILKPKYVEKEGL